MHPSMRMVVFSFEKGYEGRSGQSERIYRYLATTYEVFWEKYSRMTTPHYYEARSLTLLLHSNDLTSMDSADSRE